MAEVTRRDALKLLAVAGATAAGCSERGSSKPGKHPATSKSATPTAGTVLAVERLGFSWKTRDPFLFCVHHDDRYPAGNAQMGPAPSTLVGRNMGSDFTVKDGWRMYHGQKVPGFPQHPHRGFETVTVVRRGLLDHSDSMGAAARYGGGDVQWLTAGKGILHAEMFPLLKSDQDNPLELFQIWLNLPRKNKMVPPHFSMLWNKLIPRHVARDAAKRETRVAVIAGSLASAKPASPPPNSWASQAGSDVAMWTIKMAPGAQWTVPAAAKGTHRTLYFFRGKQLKVAGKLIPAYHQVQVRPEVAIALEAGPDEVEILLLQGRPIGEPVVKHGPFVMNTRQEIRQAYQDYRRTQFGGWPWKNNEPVHERGQARFARHADGRKETPS